MTVFIQTALAFPVVLLSFLLSISILYWCVAALGIIDVDVLDIEVESSLENASLQPEGLAGLLLKFGLSGVPVTLVLTLLFFFAWLFCYFTQLYVLSFLPLGILRYPLGLVLAAIALLLAVPVCGFLVRPLRPLFLKAQAVTRSSLLGQVVLVRSGRVTSSGGQATLENGGAGLILQIRANEPAEFKRGDHVVLLEYLEAENAYRVITEDEFKGV